MVKVNSFSFASSILDKSKSFPIFKLPSSIIKLSLVNDNLSFINLKSDTVAFLAFHQAYNYKHVKIKIPIHTRIGMHPIIPNTIVRIL